jgi:DNA-binding LytR/AlgR family response regulator
MQLDPITPQRLSPDSDLRSQVGTPAGGVANLKPSWPALVAGREADSTLTGTESDGDRHMDTLLGLLRKLVDASAAGRYLHWIVAAAGRQSRLIGVTDVLYFQADAKYTRVVTRDAEAVIRTPLKELLAELDPGAFWPIHRSTIVNAHAIAAIVRDERGRLAVRLKQRDERLPVSDAHAARFRAM